MMMIRSVEKLDWRIGGSMLCLEWWICSVTRLVVGLDW